MRTNTITLSPITIMTKNLKVFGIIIFSNPAVNSRIMATTNYLFSMFGQFSSMLSTIIICVVKSKKNIFAFSTACTFKSIITIMGKNFFFNLIIIFRAVFTSVLYYFLSKFRMCGVIITLIKSSLFKMILSPSFCTFVSLFTLFRMNAKIVSHIFSVFLAFFGSSWHNQIISLKVFIY